jgi:hypothetical protein
MTEGFARVTPLTHALPLHHGGPACPDLESGCLVVAQPHRPASYFVQDLDVCR